MTRAALGWLVVTCGCAGTLAATAEEPCDKTEVVRDQPPAPAPPAAATPPSAAPASPGVESPSAPDPRGWYCAQIRRTERDERYVSVCNRTRQDCETMLAINLSRLRLDEPRVTTDCAPRAQVNCYVASKPIDRYHERICSDTMDNCVQNRALDVKESRNYYEFTECAVVD